MKAYSALVDDPDHWVEMTFEAGDMQFVNNYHVLHGRREYVDDTESGRVRWLKRLWLATEILGPEDRRTGSKPPGQRRTGRPSAPRRDPAHRPVCGIAFTP